MRGKKKWLIALAGAVALIVLGMIGFFVFTGSQPSTKPTPSPTASIDPSVEANNQWENLQTDKKYDTAVEKFSAYFNSEESSYTEAYQDNLTIPALYVVGNYIEQGYFNKYFVSNFWATEDKNDPNSLDYYLGKYVTDKYKETLMTAPPSEVSNRIYTPDTNFTIPEKCATDWDENECFYLPPTIDKITLSEGTADTVKMTAHISMYANVQSGEYPLGQYTQQERKYTLVFQVVNTNPEVKNLSFTDIRIEGLTSSLDIDNTDPLYSE